MTSPPVAPSRKKYATVEARCGACVMLGGEEDTCMKPAALAAYEKSTGHPCPYRDLDPRNGEASLIAQVLLSTDLRHGATSIIDSTCAGMSQDERTDVLRRVVGAVSSREVHRVLHPPRDTPTPPSQPRR